ncbi:MAG: VCBS repeat-containing protein [Nitrospirae bacterium]|nr:VCBS repeat-containing protein [Candidatus Troglogloeales bacterium]
MNFIFIFLISLLSLAGCGENQNPPTDKSVSISMKMLAPAPTGMKAELVISDASGKEVGRFPMNVLADSTVSSTITLKTGTGNYTFKIIYYITDEAGNLTLMEATAPLQITSGQSASLAQDAFTTNTSFDDDKDGVTNLVETRAGTNPRAISFLLTVTRTGAGSGTVISNPFGIDCGDICSGTSTSGTSVTLTAVPDSASTFFNWGGDCGGTASSTNLTMNANKTCTATFNQFGSESFDSAKNFDTGTSTVSVAIGDFNNDGRPDIATANFDSVNVSILLNTGTGTSTDLFGSATNFDVTTNPIFVAIGDFNNNNNPDLAVANGTGVSILLGTGTSTDLFASAKNFDVTTNPIFVAIGDVDGDDNLDLVTANGSNTVSILLGNGVGSFGSDTKFGIGTTTLSVAIGDLHGDGNLDLVTANYFDNTVSILPGNGNGSFGSATNFAVGTNPRSVVIGDVNDDGELDIVTANESGTVSILRGTGSETSTELFGSATNFVAGKGPYSVAIADFNGDDRPDLAIANYFSNNVSILLGDGLGSFGSAANFAVGTHPRSVVIGDFNGDGKPDLAIANEGSNNVSILINR